MILAGLQLDRFGARTDLPLSDISEQLNVVYGPNGSGKTTVIQFIRWMMFGQRDEISQRYLSNSGSTASGSMTIREGHATRTLRRTSQSGSMLSQLTVEGGASTAVNAPISISNSEFDRFFVISFDQPRTVGDLFNSARSHGLQLHVDQRQLDRVRQLTEQIARHRSELARFGNYGTVEVLRSHREDKRREIESIRLDWQRRREELERNRHQLASAVSEQQMLVDRLRSVVANIDSAVETRKRQLAEEHAQWLAARQESEERRRRRIQEIDGQIARWQGILTEVRSRLEQVRARITSFGDVGFSATEATDLHFFMRKLGFRIRDIEQDLSGVYESETWRDHEADAEYLRGLLGSALNSMQSDVTRLAQTVERQQQTNELHECREELTSLCRVEQELSDLIDALGRQRHNLSRESEFLPNIYGTSRSQSDFSTDVISTQHNPVTGLSTNPTLENSFTTNVPSHASDAIRQNLYSVSPLELATALDDFRLRHLVERREAANARLRSAELELTNRQRSLREVEEELSRLEATGRIQVLEREIAEIDEQIRQLELRLSLERTIASLEEELRRAREHSGRSEVIDEASVILQRLTNDDYREIRVATDHQCRITRADGQNYTYSQLSRGVQDQVYLAISLAIVNRYARKGVAAPVILNDVFANLDESGTQALADVLSQFSSQGNQTIVFTRHMHVRELLQSRNARLFQLSDMDSSRREVPAPYVPPTYVPPRTYVPPTPVVELQPEPVDPTYQWVAEWQRRDPVHTTPPTPIVPAIKPAPIKQVPIKRPRVEPPRTDPPESTSSKLTVQVQPAITLETPLTRVTTLADDLVQLLADIGMHQVGDFLDVDPDAVADPLVEHGVTAEMIQRRQRELLMLVYLGVSKLDAQLLVACGVPDPARLSRADEAVLLKRVETILERPQATQRFGAFSQYNLARIRAWIDAARNSAYKGRSRRSYSSNVARSPRRTTERVRSTKTERPERSRAERPVVTQTTLKMKTPSQRSQSKKQNGGLRFYLETNDPVVDAPSIGPKTAEKLNEFDIYTVTDLLSANAATLAAQLDDNRISADDIEQWQLQAQLVCQIPNLRGHDAQILVACGVEDPITLSSLDAGTFLKRVTKFVGSSDGKRVIRNNKKPDLAEVAAWIEWSESARQLQAA